MYISLIDASVTLTKYESLPFWLNMKSNKRMRVGNLILHILQANRQIIIILHIRTCNFLDFLNYLTPYLPLQKKCFA